MTEERIANKMMGEINSFMARWISNLYKIDSTTEGMKGNIDEK